MGGASTALHDDGADANDDENEEAEGVEDTADEVDEAYEATLEAPLLDALADMSDDSDMVFDAAK